ncbi:hypothetical protein D6851_00590 [Altericroceibacterium spongiae]|uniref:Phage shock protein B n=1 Tax=Altericroceibacterium spongiae TaxID=2320269 RepID=A0A420EQT8_9SPHN|nr:hypothetical protein [Altericroceibacterium spongiae]RKF23043.1 hypothetical protein D6851_00590 [Altericroceibacterium spongiae]
MHFWNAVIIIVAIVAIARIIRYRQDRNGPRHSSEEEDGHYRLTSSVREMEDELSDLRERVRVLERIATEDRSSRELSDEINKLREK